MQDNFGKQRSTVEQKNGYLYPAGFNFMPDDNQGFTLIEVAIVMVIVMALATIAIPNYINALNTARVSRSISDIRNIDKAVNAYLIDMAKLPVNLAAVGYGGQLDAWNRPYIYSEIAQLENDLSAPLNLDFDLYSKGFDGNSNPAAGNPENKDDVVRGSDGVYVGLRPCP